MTVQSTGRAAWRGPWPRSDPARRRYLEEVAAKAREIAAATACAPGPCPEERAEAARVLFAAGASVAQAAEALGVCEDTARRVRGSLLDAGVVLPALPSEVLRDEERQVVALVDGEGLSYSAAAERLGWTKSKVARAVRRARSSRRSR